MTSEVPEATPMNTLFKNRDEIVTHPPIKDSEVSEISATTSRRFLPKGLSVRESGPSGVHHSIDNMLQFNCDIVMGFEGDLVGKITIDYGVTNADDVLYLIL